MILKGHKGRILAETDKQMPGQYQQRGHDVTVAPSYAELGIHPKQASREQLVAWLACYTQDEIAEEVGMDRASAVSGFGGVTGLVV